MVIERLPGSDPRFDRWDKVGNIYEARSQIDPFLLPSYRAIETQYNELASHDYEFSLPQTHDGTYLQYVVTEPFAPYVPVMIHHWGKIDKTPGILEVKNPYTGTHTELVDLLFSYTKLFAAVSILNQRITYVPFTTDHPTTLLRAALNLVALTHAKKASLAIPGDDNPEIQLKETTPQVHRALVY